MEHEEKTLRDKKNRWYLIAAVFIILCLTSFGLSWFMWRLDSNKSTRTSDTWKLDPNKSALVIRAGESDPLTLTLNGDKASVNWASSNTAIAAVDENGNVHGVSKGDTSITAHYNGAEVLSLPVYVEREALPPLAPISAPRFGLVDGVYVNHNADKTNKALLMFTGDLMCLFAQQRHAIVNNTYNFNPSFSYVKNVFGQADFVAGNLETMLSQSAPFKLEQTNISAPGGMRPNCNAPATFLDALRYAGFDALVAANNHNLDAGIRGILETIDNLNRYKLPQTGIFASKEDERNLLFEINGIKVAMLSYATNFNSWQNAHTKKELDIHVNNYSAKKAKKDIELARSRGAEYVIVYIHWGGQNAPKLTNNQLKYAQELADAGADYIIGTHPHVLQRYDILKTADERLVPVMYSMGNFLSSMDDVENMLNRDAVILQIELEKNEPGRARLVNDGYIPCFICTVHRGKRYVVLPCDKNLNGGYTSKNVENSRQRTKQALGDKIKEVDVKR